MYYRRALKLQAFLDMAKESGTMKNFLDYLNILKKKTTEHAEMDACKTCYLHLDY